MSSRGPKWVNRVTLTVGRPLPVDPDQRTSSDRPGISGWCHKFGLARRSYDWRYWTGGRVRVEAPNANEQQEQTWLRAPEDFQEGVKAPPSAAP